MSTSIYSFNLLGRVINMLGRVNKYSIDNDWMFKSSYFIYLWTLSWLCIKMSTDPQEPVSSKMVSGMREIFFLLAINVIGDGDYILGV